MVSSTSVDLKFLFALAYLISASVLQSEFTSLCSSVPITTIVSGALVVKKEIALSVIVAKQ
jgi:hypothetical protein